MVELFVMTLYIRYARFDFIFNACHIKVITLSDCDYISFVTKDGTKL